MQQRASWQHTSHPSLEERPKSRLRATCQTRSQGSEVAPACRLGCLIRTLEIAFVPPSGTLKATLIVGLRVLPATSGRPGRPGLAAGGASNLKAKMEISRTRNPSLFRLRRAVSRAQRSLGLAHCARWVRTGCPKKGVACRLGSFIIKTASSKKKAHRASDRDRGSRSSGRGGWQAAGHTYAS